MSASQDRRRPPPRRTANLFVSSSDGTIRLARTLDLSLTGVFVETDARPPVGTTLEVSIAWGNDIYSCLARVVRTTPNGVGLTFVNPDTLMLQALQEIMDSAPATDPTGNRS